MISQLKTLSVRMVAGANIATIFFMFLVGYSDRLHPAEHPMLSNVGLVFPFFLLLNIGFLIFWLVFKWRWSVIPIVGFLLCFSPTRAYFPLNVSRNVPDDAIKFISYNVYHFATSDSTLYPNDGEAVRSNPIIEYLVAQNADIVCLQEAGTSKQNIVDERDSVLASVYQYSDSVMVCKSGEVLFIYSKFPILKKKRIDLDDKGYFCAVFWLKIGRDTVMVINNHLQGTGLTPDERNDFGEMVSNKKVNDSTELKTLKMIQHLDSASVKRASQIDCLAQFVRENAGKSILLCGDFNDHPISYARRTIANELEDCYVESGNGAGISYNSHSLYVRIDHLFCSKDWTPYNCKLDKSIAYSDHYPLVCWLKKRSKP